MRKPWIIVACLLAVAVAALGNGIHILLKYQAKIGAREAGSYLILLGSILTCLALAFFFQAGKIKGGKSLRDQEGIRWVPIAVALLAGYALFFDLLGYLLTTALFLILYLRIFGSYRWASVLMASLVAAAGTAYLWATVGLMLPEGILPWP